MVGLCLCLPSGSAVAEPLRACIEPPKDNDLRRIRTRRAGLRHPGRWSDTWLPRRIIYVPAADSPGPANTGRVLRLCRSSLIYRSKPKYVRDTGAELILIILLVVGGIIYAIFASNPMSFDDLIELRFLPSRRRRRNPKSTTGVSPSP